MTEDQSVTLHDYWRSSSSYRVRIALAVLDMPVTTLAVDLVKGAQTSAANLDRNKQGLVPTLEVDGLCLTQSLAIIEYLDETRGAGFLPPDAVGRARVRALAMSIAMDIQPVCNLRVARYAMAKSDGRIDQAEWMRHFITLGLTAFEAMLAPDANRFCHGTSVTLADLCLVPQVYNARRWGVDMDALPKISRIDAHLTGLPAFRRAAPQTP